MHDWIKPALNAEDAKDAEEHRRAKHEDTKEHEEKLLK
jgi:hypothetical protein